MVHSRARALIDRLRISRYRRLGIVAALSLALVVTACSSTGSNSSDGGGNGGVVKIGMITDETGPIAPAGKAFADGGRIAAAEINQDGLLGHGHTLEFVTKEAAADPAKSANVANQLAGDKSVVGLICCILTPVAGAVTPIAVKNKLPMIIWGATDTGLAKPPYVFRTVTMPQPANEKLAQVVTDKTNIKSIAYAVMTDNAGMVSQADAFKKGFTDAGVKNLGTVGTLSTQTDLTGAASQLVAMHPDAIAVSGTQANNQAMLSALHNRNYNGVVVSGETISGPGVFKSNPDAVAGVPFPVYFIASQANEAGQRFAKDYKAKYGTEPEDYAAQGFNAVYTMAMAIKAAGNSVTRDSITKGLNGLTTVDNTIYGQVSFKDGQMSAQSNVKIVNYTKPNGDVKAWTPGAGS